MTKYIPMLYRTISLLAHTDITDPMDYNVLNTDIFAFHLVSTTAKKIMTLSIYVY